MAEFIIQTQPDSRMYLKAFVGNGHGEDGATSFEVTTTVGMGSAVLLLKAERNGKSITESTDLRELIAKWVEHLDFKLRAAEVNG